jgi:Flp pilus assembly protein TadB
MRFPSLIRLPKHRRFNVEPRYYDPIKEDIEERTERIRQELKGMDGEFKPGNITFNRKTKSVPNTSFLQLLIAAVLGSLVIGWLFYGNDVFYAFVLVIPIYLYFRLRKRTSRR